MEIQAMGKVFVTAKIENMEDLYKTKQGLLPAEQVHTVEVTDALVDTGASTLCMPKRLIAQLGLEPFACGKRGTRAGPVTLQVHGTARLSIQGRDCPCDVVELPDDRPVLIGPVPLVAMDWVIDPVAQQPDW